MDNGEPFRGHLTPTNDFRVVTNGLGLSFFCKYRLYKAHIC